MFKITCILLLFYVLNCATRQYRFDYKYDREAEGWFKFHQIPSNWNEARLRCLREGAVLVSPLNEKLKTAIINHMKQHDVPQCGMFSGIHALFSKGDYTSIEGVNLLKMPITWTYAEPDNFEDSESCLIILSNGTMADVKCSETFPYMCFKKNLPININPCGTIDNEYKFEARTGSCYKFHRVGIPWTRAYMTCVAEGGYLTIINSEVEAQVLREMFARNPDNTIKSQHPTIASIGFHDWGERSTWLTIHGEPLEAAGYSLWAQGQPDNATSARTGDVGEFCGSIFRSAQLNDIWCNTNVAFICEKDPASLVDQEE